MTVNYTTLLQLPQPVDGTEAGTWGDVLNNAQAAYLDIAIAGGLAVSITSADVTLTATQGTSSATNIGSTTSQYAILNVSGAMTGARNLIVPSTSKWYIINNTCTGVLTGPLLARSCTCRRWAPWRTSTSMCPGPMGTNKPSTWCGHSASGPIPPPSFSAAWSSTSSPATRTTM